jgi:hypothetical protein
MHKILPGTNYSLPFEVKLSSQTCSLDRSGSVDKRVVMAEFFMNPKLIIGEDHDLVTTATT